MLYHFKDVKIVLLERPIYLIGSWALKIVDPALGANVWSNKGYKLVITPKLPWW
jgi:hypothetical protein